MGYQRERACVHVGQVFIHLRARNCDGQQATPLGELYLCVCASFRARWHSGQTWARHYVHARVRLSFGILGARKTTGEASSLKRLSSH